MFYDMGVAFYVWVNNYIYMYVLPPQYAKRKRLTKSCMPKQGLIVPCTNMFSCQYLFRFMYCKTLFSCVQYVYKLSYHSHTMMRIISVRRIPRVCVLQHIKRGVLGTKSRFSCAGTTRKVREGGLRSGQNSRKGH